MEPYNFILDRDSYAKGKLLEETYLNGSDRNHYRHNDDPGDATGEARVTKDG